MSTDRRQRNLDIIVKTSEEFISNLEPLKKAVRMGDLKELEFYKVLINIQHNKIKDILEYEIGELNELKKMRRKESAIPLLVRIVN